LKKKFNNHFNVQIINEDILNVDFKQLTKQYKNPLLIANLPYSISTPMLLKFLKQECVKKFYCMLQDEFVERVIARPKTKDYNGFSILVQTYATVQTFFKIPPTAFHPQPKINSRFILLESKELQFNEK
jgi:16S rRNA (adenine1518-N6/adenine1519-N6)-dimethyltransferase